MPNHYMHYIQRRVVMRFPKDPKHQWFAELQGQDSGFEMPVYHVSRSHAWPVPEIQAGDRIWLVGQLTSPWGSLPPALDACFQLESVRREWDAEKQLFKWRFAAGPESFWLRLRNATELLQGLDAQTKDGSIYRPWGPQSRNPRNNLGMAFRNLRRLPETAALEQWAEETQNQPFDFISYRIKDGSRAAFHQAQSLLADGKTLAWDRWALPRRLAERRELVSDDALDQRLLSEMHQARTVWGIESKLYGEEDSYSAKEKAYAIQQKTYRPVKLAR